MRQPDSAALRAAGDSLGLAVSDAQAEQLLSYLELLNRWNATFNLTAIREIDAMVTRHLLDCMAAVPSLIEQSPDGGIRLLDVGTGNGLPGVVIAVLLSQCDVTCLDAVGKKAAFVRQAGGALGLTNLHAVHCRVQDLRAPAFDVITARAFSSLRELVVLTERHLAAGGHWMAMKGPRPDDEIVALPAGIDAFHVEQLAVPGLDAERCLVWMRRALPDGLP